MRRTMYYKIGSTDFVLCRNPEGDLVLRITGKAARMINKEGLYILLDTPESLKKAKEAKRYVKGLEGRKP